MEEQKDVLYVRMFGRFSISWNGRLIAGGAKSSETQFSYLMQLLLHNKEQGVRRSDLEQVLFGDRNIKNQHHAMRSVIYNARKRLKAVCLPDAEYIECRGGIYYWTDEIPVAEDAGELERLFREAQKEEDPERRLGLWLDACHCYTGEFLETQAGLTWVAKEARRYREIFCICVEEAAVLLRERQDYVQMEALGRYAAKIYPFSDWEAVTMEALVSSGRDDEARKFYDDTTSLYLEELGLRPSVRLTELLHRLGDQIGHRYTAFDEIQAELLEKEEKEPGGFLCTWPVFQGVYQMIRRMVERTGQSAYLMLCTIVDSKGNPVKDGFVLERLSERLCGVLLQSVRRSDVVNKYGKGQYLLLLLNTTQEDCRVLQRRINGRFRVGRQRIGVHYYVKSVISVPDL